VPFGAKAYQLTNFKIIHGEVPPPPVLHIEPMFFSLTLGGEAGTYPETGVWYIDEMQYVQVDNIKIVYYPMLDKNNDPEGLGK
jgi:hypothetical protein